MLLFFRLKIWINPIRPINFIICLLYFHRNSAAFSVTYFNVIYSSYKPEIHFRLFFNIYFKLIVLMYIVLLSLTFIFTI